MEKLYLFVSRNRFKSEAELDQFIEAIYDVDGECIDSAFMEEVSLYDYEPGCIEAVFNREAILLHDLLQGSSYFEQWQDCVDDELMANAAVIVYEPNRMDNPAGTSLDYLGEYEYDSSLD